MSSKDGHNSGVQQVDATNLSDMQLMRLLDGDSLVGELFEGQPLASDERLQADLAISEKLAQLDLVGSFVREAIDTDERADSIVDVVMARITEGRLPQVVGSLEEIAAAPFAVAGAEVLPFPTSTQVPEAAEPRQAGAANDNARKIFALAAAAAAVAAGLFMWGQGSGQIDAPTAATTARLNESAVVALAEPAPETRSDERGRVDEEEADDPVEIAAVDFGQLTGSVFYVPGEEAGATTAVVWVNDSGDDQ